MANNRDNGLDYHLRMLGIQDREYWEILSIDEKGYDNLIVRCRPDWVLHNLVTDEFRVADYKSRSLGFGKPSAYERYQVILNAATVSDDLEYRLNRAGMRVTAQLVYGDGQTRMVAYTDEDTNDLMRLAAEVATDLYLRGETPSPKTLVAATRVAQVLAGMPQRRDGGIAKSAGIRAHISLLNGPRPSVKDRETDDPSKLLH